MTTDLPDHELRARLVAVGFDPVLVRDQLAAGARDALLAELKARERPAWPPKTEVKATR